MSDASPRLTSGPAVVLHAERARITVDDAIAVSSLDTTTRGARVVLAGDVTALLAAITGVPLAVSTEEHEAKLGEARVVSGTLRVAGRSVGDDEQFAVMGAAPLDPRLPPSWTVEQYVTWSARLAGASKRLARELASVALARVGLLSAARRPLGSLAVPERRALLLAHAAVLSPDVVVAEAPLSGLDGAGADLVANALACAVEGRGAIVSVSRLDPGTAEGRLARAATDLVVLSAGELLLDGSPGDVLAGTRVYALTLRGDPEPLRAELAARGIALRGGPGRCALSLPPDRAVREVLAAAVATRVVVLELVPLLG